MKIPSVDEFREEARVNNQRDMLSDETRKGMYARWSQKWYFRTWQWWQLRRLSKELHKNASKGYSFGAFLYISSMPYYSHSRYEDEARLYACQTLCNKIETLGYQCKCELVDYQACWLDART